jgi:hypothetical protein
MRIERKRSKTYKYKNISFNWMNAGESVGYAPFRWLA